MFVLPSIEEQGGFPALIILGQLFGSLLRYGKENKFKYRIGFSYGNLFLDVLNIGDYKEWMLFGEPTVVAKRIMSLNEIKNPDPIITVVGIKKELKPENMPSITTISEICAGCSSSWKVDIKAETELKGVGKITFHTWIPNQ